MYGFDPTFAFLTLYDLAKQTLLYPFVQISALGTLLPLKSVAVRKLTSNLHSGLDFLTELDANLFIARY